jgi:hypothetical protein
MADDTTLHVREREVEAARAKLAADLAILSSPRTFSEFTNDLKADATNLKDDAIEKVKSSAQSAVQNLLEDIKGRAAANPAAVLAIGAGIAWRLVRHPPITTALIGAGLYSLFRTTPAARPQSNESFLSQARDRLRVQVTDFSSAAKDQAQEFGATITDKTSELASRMTESVSALSQTAADKITETASAATDRAKQWSEGAQTSVSEWAHEAKAAVSGQQASPAASTAEGPRSSNLQQSWSPSLQPAQPSRDTLLLSVAGVAVAAAMGMALQRRMSEGDDNR